MHLDTRVLTLTWPEMLSDTTLHLEREARRLRYQAIGDACRKADINTLLVGHHADDQAETVLVRLTNNYLGSGLSGIKAHKPVPECHGMYGVHESGNPQALSTPAERTAGPQRVRSTSNKHHSNTHASERILIEGGGLSISRPLLPYSKDELVSYCMNMGVRWHEDNTNADPQFALRNTVRYLLNKHLLPVALRAPRLLEVAAGVATGDSRNEAKANQEFATLDLLLDVRCGTLVVENPSFMQAFPSNDGSDLIVGSLVIRKLLTLVAPTEVIQMPDAYGAAAKLVGQRQSAIQIAGIAICERQDARGVRIWVMQRKVPSAQELITQSKRLTAYEDLPQAVALKTTRWLLWDSRYWVCVYHRDPNVEVTIRFLTAQDLALLRTTHTPSVLQRLEQVLRLVPGKQRFTLPVLAARRRSDGVEQAVIVALPTLGWSIDGWRKWPASSSVARDSEQVGYWDIRYKKVDLESSRKHTILDSGA
ncbi:hypothetical protein LTR62_007623 [Meristemomyces frigidus]|uniref:tRNA(Ile)-lysidine synthetase n=1 Tax=Meristemomyces frigidus TaxID=1508187 RepID=A0AAN7TAN6_9PEZI|nr:hypothetical protein LTR62_007623 [Meristemomyces frigidus]